MDYCDRNDFDYDDPQIRIFGWVHERSEAALHTQYLNVMTGVKAAIRGPSNPHSSQVSEFSPSVSQEHRVTSNVHVTSTCGGATRSGAPPPLQRNSTSGGQPSVATEGSIPIQQMEAIIRNLQDYAERNNLKWPAKIGREGMEAMANDGKLRQEKDFAIRDALRKQQDE